MPDPNVTALRSLVASGTFLHPLAATNTVDLALALADIAGAEGLSLGEGSSELRREIGDPKHLIFVLADGLGMNLVERLPPESLLRRHLLREIRAVFPSSTAPALTSLATGTWPGEHALPTWYTYLPAAKLTAVLLPYVDRRGGPALTLDPRAVFPAPVLAPRFSRPFLPHQPAPIARSIYTLYVTGGIGARGYQSFEICIERLLADVRKAAGPTYSYAYFPDIDTAEHEGGVRSPKAWSNVLRLDRALDRLKSALGDDCRMVVSADHGQITVPETSKRLLPDGQDLQPFLSVWPPAGEPRMTSFHVKPGAREPFIEAFEAEYGDELLLLGSEEAASEGLFGPKGLVPETRARVGEFIAVPKGDCALIYAREPNVVAMRGMHGGLSPEEMRIPLVVA
jgi:hypothetical protein